MEPKDILQLESSDERQAYLFEENGRWLNGCTTSSKLS